MCATKPAIDYINCTSPSVCACFQVFIWPPFLDLGGYPSTRSHAPVKLASFGRYGWHGLLSWTVPSFLVDQINLISISH